MKAILFEITYSGMPERKSWRIEYGMKLDKAEKDAIEIAKTAAIDVKFYEIDVVNSFQVLTHQEVIQTYAK